MPEVPRCAAVLFAVGTLVAAPRVGVAEPAEVRALVDERFDEPHAVPAYGTYETPPSDLQARGERWHLIVEPGSSATARVQDGAAVVQIERAGLHWYAVQLAYRPLRIQPGHTYRITFRGRAERSVLTTFDLAHVGEGWHSYSGQKGVEL